MSQQISIVPARQLLRVIKKSWLSPSKLLQVIKSRLDGHFAKVGASSLWCARLYYGVINGSYAYEQRSLLAGRKAYSRLLTESGSSIALVRRNVHRLEKGLLMQPRRIPFALDYIEETVNGFCVASQSGKLDPVEQKWASHVLAEYFRVCVGEKDIEKHRATFKQCLADAPDEDHDLFIPYVRDVAKKPNITISQMHQLAKYRRSVRWFLPGSVPRKIIDDAIVVGGYSPSACNRQPFQFRVFDEPSLVKEIAEIPMGTAGYAHNIPCIVVLVGQLRNYFSERDRHLIYIDASLAAMSFIFALECQGVSTCCINWPEIESKNEKMAKTLGLSTDERPVMCIAVGYPDPNGMVAYSAKKPLSIIRRYNHE